LKIFNTATVPSADAPADQEPSATVFRIPSSSRPGAFNTVTVVDGKARCDCSGFAYRRTCSHAKGVVSELLRKG